MTMRLMWLVVFGIVLVTPIYVVAEDFGTLDELEQKLKEAAQQKESLDHAEQVLTQDQKKLLGQEKSEARQISLLEKAIAAKDAELDKMSASIEKKGKALRDAQIDIELLLGPLAQVSARAGLGMFLMPPPGVRGLEAVRLLAGIYDSFAARAGEIDAEVTELASLQKQVIVTREQLTKQQADLQAHRQELGLLLNKNRLARQTNEKEQAALEARSQELAESAANLRELVEKSSKKPAHSSDDNDDDTGNLALRRLSPTGAGYGWPAKGAIIAGYKAPGGKFGESNGIVIETSPVANISAPYDGKILFAGPFRSFGQILIIAHRGGYHTVLAGLERLDAALDQVVLTGEHLGVMGPKEQTGSSVLYLELRHGDKYVDPIKWLPKN